MKTTIKLKLVAVLCVMLMITQSGKAQYDAMFTQYMFNEMFINPAYAGSKEAMSTTLLHRQQWVNFPGRPITTSFSLHGPVMGNKMGLGLSVLNEKVGPFNRNLVYGSYAYRLKLTDKQTLAFGLMTGIDNQMNKFSSVQVSDGSAGSVVDPQFAQNTPSMYALNFGGGVYYTTKTFYGGLSIPRMLDNVARFSSKGEYFKVTSFKASKFTYYITAGNMFTLNEDLKLRASTMIKVVKNARPQMDLGANFLVKEVVWAGLNYRTNSALAVLVGAQVNKQFFVSYSYDFTLNRLRKYSQGSHEIALNYLFSFKSKKVITPRYF